jgi:hypothetical protein
MKKQFSLLAVTLCAVATVFISCDGAETETDKQIELTDPSEQNQQAFADERSTGEFTFATKAAWSADVDYVSADSRLSIGTSGTSGTSEQEVQWVRLLLDGQETYGGNAGTVTLDIEVDMNFSGNERSATIIVTSGDDTIYISVTQKAVKEDNEPLTAAGPIVAHPWKHVRTFTDYVAPADAEDDEFTDPYTLTFGTDGSAVIGSEFEDWSHFFVDEDTYLCDFDEGGDYTISGENLAVSITDGEDVYGPAIYTIKNLSDTELEIRGGPFAEGTYDGDGKLISNDVFYVTIQFVKP